MGDLTSNAEVIPAKHILFIMDACYSGLAIQRSSKAGPQRFISDMLQRVSRQVITAGKADEPVSDGGGPTGMNSIFTGHLLEGAQGKAADKNGVLTANGLMHYVYQKVAADPQSIQTPHYGHLYGDGDFILLTPDDGHLSSGKHEDFLVEVLPEKPEPAPQAVLNEIKPVFATRSGYSDPQSSNFGHNEWTEKLGSVEYRDDSEPQLVTASHWLALVAEPVSNQKIDFDLPRLMSLLKSQPIQGNQPFQEFRIPSQVLTTSRSVVFYDRVQVNTSAGERWKRFMRVDQEGAIEYGDYVGAAAKPIPGRGNVPGGPPIKVFLYVQIIGLLWKFMFAAKKILHSENYEAGVRILVNLVGAKDSMLVAFARGEGKDGQHWRDPFEGQAIIGDSLQNWRCRDLNFQAEFQCALGSLREAESKKLVVQCAQRFGLAYNHQSAPHASTTGQIFFPGINLTPIWTDVLRGRQKEITFTFISKSCRTPFQT